MRLDKWVVVGFTVLALFAVYAYFSLSTASQYAQTTGNPDGDEFAALVYNYKPPLRYAGFEEFKWVNPNTGSQYSTASWSYGISVTVRGISSWNATIWFEGRLQGSANWVVIDSYVKPNTTETNMDTHTVTVSDSGSEDISAHMGRFVSNPAANQVYTVEYRVRWEWYGVGYNSHTVYNLTGYSESAVATGSAKNYVAPPTFSGTSVVEGSKYGSGSVTDGSTSTYVYDNTITQGDRARVQIQLTGCSGDWSSVDISVTLEAFYLNLYNATFNTIKCF